MGLRLLNSMHSIILFLDPEYEAYVSALSVFLKFSVSLSFYVLQLQALETYPTCVRQTGQAVGLVLSNALGTFAPYIVHLVNTN